MADFKGQIVHPQHWTPDVQWAGKRVVVIGSGATAVTLLPELAQTAAHVTLLQRSPTYMVSRPEIDPIAVWLNRYLPPKLSYALTRGKNVLMGMFFYRLAKTKPKEFANKLIEGVQQQLGPGYDVGKHFTPAYKPWDQRLCLVPHGDLFRSIREGKASVATEHIDRFTPEGILLKTGQMLNADLIVTATGLDLQALGGIALAVDGKRIKPNDCLGYKGMMLSGVPNLANVFGYTNASWTLKSDLTSKYVCRLLNHMAKTGARQCTPTLSDASVAPAPWVDFSSGYIQRSLDRFPQQGNKAPWRLHQNYALDLLSLKFGRLNDGAMVFRR
jgi:cation diffusion facilitator CzcD-associated flavoprotein CzcO